MSAPSGGRLLHNWTKGQAVNRVIPRGAVVADLGRRVVAAVIDVVPLLIIGGLTGLLSLLTAVVANIVGALLGVGFLGYQWWAYATQGAGLGARVMGLRVVSVEDGQPIGWWRCCLRYLIFNALMGTLVGGLALLYFLVRQERHQGWHDLVTNALVVEDKAQSTAPERPRQSSTVTSTPGMPPQLAAKYAPEWGAGEEAGWAPAEQQATPVPAPQGPRRSASPTPQSPTSTASPTPPHSPARRGSAPWPSDSPTPAPASTPARQSPAQSSPSQSPSGPKSPGQNPSPAPAPQAPWQPLGAPPSQYTPGSVSPESAITERAPQKAWIPLPTPTSVIEPSSPKPARNLPEDGDSRAVEDRPGDEGWYLRLDDGREVELVVTVLLGRNPQKGPDDPEVHLVPSSGDGRMISRTHVLIGVDPRGVYVVDRDSTNGTALVTSSGELKPCPASVPMRVREGQQVSYGNRWFTVLRRP